MGDNRLFKTPSVGEAWHRLAMSREKAASVFPEQRPKLVGVGGGHFQGGQGFAAKKLKAPFGVRRREVLKLGFYLKKEHQPVRLSLIPSFADYACEVKSTRRELEREFFGRF